MHPTLIRYVSRHFLVALLGTLLVTAGLILLFDVIELLRQTAKVEEATLGMVVSMGLLRLPLVLQTGLPFAFLAAAMIAFWRLARSSELVVIRAAGVSVWQVLVPLVVLSMVLGAINVAAGNPIAAALFTQFERKAHEIGIGGDNPFSLSQGGMWLRESTDDGFTIVHARDARQENRVLFLSDVMVLEMGPDDLPTWRADAEQARLAGNRFLLTGAMVSVPGRPPERYEMLSVETNLSLPKIQERFAAPESMSFWDLPDFIAFFESAGFSAEAHRMHWHAMISSPALLCAMVLLAAVFGFNARQRQGAWLIRVTGCALTGFVIYFFSQVTYTLGQSQTLPVALAAWAPALVSALLGAALLFHLEDG
ncbi:LPS export ABC transporter permease LptG [Roseospira navarrensis]|uniref:LPS export ABC transporter permease LptG n=1 Tax=Roseospira navarrensis TaxID=140058 RepID=UPI001FEAA78E|nr:LPS export ABC transporter permease LptG [Roseospira navarrensis]